MYGDEIPEIEENSTPQTANGKIFYQWMKPIFATKYGSTYGIFCSSEVTAEKLFPPMLGMHYSYGPAERRIKYEFRIPQGEIFDAILSAIEQTRTVNHEINTRSIAAKFNAAGCEISRDKVLIGRVVT